MHAHVFSLIGVCQWSTGYHVTKIRTFMVRPATTKRGIVVRFQKETMKQYLPFNIYMYKASGEIENVKSLNNYLELAPRSFVSYFNLGSRTMHANLLLVIAVNW